MRKKRISEKRIRWVGSRNVLKICLLPIALFLCAIIALSCGQKTTMMLEMEIYYNMIGFQSSTVSALIRIPAVTLRQPQFGQTVFVIFAHDNDRLSPDSIIMNEPMELTPSRYYMEAVYLGSDDSTGESLVGFEFEVAGSERNAVGYKEHETKIIDAYYSIDNGKLKYDHLAIVRVEDREPVKFK
ncbi:MAG: hypothetical protein AB1746_11800 [Candidatus Zixiibacteriota bacterium]